MSTGAAFIGSKISLISNAEIRYEGILYQVNTDESTVTLAKVRSFGTEDRPSSKVIPPRSEVYEFIIFRGSDIKDLNVSEMPAEEQPSSPPQDPAILSTRSTAPVPTSSTAPTTTASSAQPAPVAAQQQQQHPPPGPYGAHPQYFPHPQAMGGYSPFGMPYFRPPVMMGAGPHPIQPGVMPSRPQPPPESATSQGVPPSSYVPPHVSVIGAPPAQAHTPPRPLPSTTENPSPNLVATPTYAPAGVEVKPQASSTPVVSVAESTLPPNQTHTPQPPPPAAAAAATTAPAAPPTHSTAPPQQQQQQQPHPSSSSQPPPRESAEAEGSERREKGEERSRQQGQAKSERGGGRGGEYRGDYSRGDTRGGRGYSRGRRGGGGNYNRGGRGGYGYQQQPREGGGGGRGYNNYTSRQNYRQPQQPREGGRGGYSRQPYNQQPREGGGYGGQSRQQSANATENTTSIKYDKEFDFESANARFSKDSLEQEFKQKLRLDSGSRKSSDGFGEGVVVDGSSPPEDDEVLVVEEEEGEGPGVEPEVEEYYDKSKSFFDNISCEASSSKKYSRNEEREVNMQTFGVSSVSRGYGYRGRRGRGRGRGGGFRGRGRYGGPGGGGGGWGGRRGNSGGYSNHRDYQRPSNTIPQSTEEREA